MNLCVAALIATWRRPQELARLLAALAKIEAGLGAVVVVDNAGDPTTRALLAGSPGTVHLVSVGENLGCGGGLRRAGEEAQQLLGDRLTHFLILDDDAVLPPEALGALVTALARDAADIAYPLVVDAAGHVGWLPGLAAAPRLKPAPGATAADFRRTFADTPRDLVWAQGICLLVTRRALEATGFHRDDFWVRGEDLDFSLRLTARFRGVFVPEVVVEHLPPPETTPASREGEYLKHCAMLQNIAYLSLRQPHGRRIAWTLPANVGRLLRTWKWRALPDVIRALWRGAICGEPAGRGAGATFHQRAARRAA